MSKKPKRSRIELPHGASLDPESGTLRIPLGQNLVSIPAFQLPDLIELLDDIQTVLDMQTKVTTTHCKSCGSIVETTDYVSPEDGDGYN